MKVIETDHLIIGTGPAGASLACFLASYGLKGIMIGAASGSAETPRAHITNMAALECLRDIGLETECINLAVSNESMLHTRWCKTLAGEEYARIYSWGNDPKRQGDYDAASPCKHVDLPQTSLEPILVRHAVLNGFTCRFDTTFLSFTRWPPSPEGQSETIVSLLRDNLTGDTYQVRSKYLYGCDGARSQVLRQLEIPLIKKPGQGLAINVLVKANLGKHVENRMGNLHWVMQPEEEHDDFGWTAIARMVKPWDEWMFILFPDRNAGNEFTTTNEQYLKRIREFIGDDSIDVQILDVSKWFINETVAERYSDGGNIFLLGDAVHRHPPMNGLGSNTCIQDAFNLAWKIAYSSSLPLCKSPALLQTFSTERQPVGQTVITRANDGVRQHKPIWEALGMLDSSVDIRRKEFAELKSATKEGQDRRERLQAAIEMTAHEFSGLGVEMNQRYDESKSTAIFLQDEGPRPPLPEDPVLYHEITTYPGSRLPHAWLNTRSPGKQFSTIDLAGAGKFCLLTGIGGEKWKGALESVSTNLGLEGRTNAFSIGWGCDYEDVYFDWTRRREIDESGCVLVRPDRYVCWRSKEMIEDPESKLEWVLRRVLG